VKTKIGNKRTLFLGAFATVVFVWASINKFDVPAEEMARLALSCVVVVLFTMLLAALTVGLIVGVRHLLRRIGLFRDPQD